MGGSDPSTGDAYSIDGVAELVVAGGHIVSENTTYDTTDSPF